MKEPSFLLICLVVSHLFLPCHSGDVDCNRNPPRGTEDCSTLTISQCRLYDDPDNGRLMGDGALPPPLKNSRTCFRTCYVNDDECRAELATAQDQSIRVAEAASNDCYTLQVILSQNYNDGNNYLKSSICRANIRCDPPRILHYSYIAHNLEEEVVCNNAPMCVDYIELDFPTYNRKNRTCGTLSTLGVLMGFDGMAELNAEIVTNRRRQHPGLSLNVYCVDPGFDRSAMPLGGTMNGNCPTNERKKRNLEDRRDCTSPNGRGRRGEPQLPPPAERIQEVLAENELASYSVLDVTESLSYCDNTLTLSNGTTIPSVTSLLVENRLGVNVFYRIAPGQYSGFAQLAVSRGEAVMVQFGVRPIFVPTEEEASFISLLETGIQEALGNSGFFTLKDEVDELEVLLPFRTEFEVERDFKRGIEPNFLDEVALEFGNACNGALRATACAYQEIVMHLDCLTGQPIYNSTVQD